jgi:hypothetical protein
MKKYWSIIIAGVLLVAMLTASCGGNVSGQTGPLRLLLSDDNGNATAIGDFQSINITVYQIGFQKAGESGWIVPEDYVPWTGNLLDLVGTNSSVIWDGYIEAGLYNKAFLYVSNITGILKPEAGGGVADIWAPSGKLQITIDDVPFTVTESGAIVDFVFDITVVKSGESGQYLIVPQIAQSGPDQDYQEVDEDNSNSEIHLRGTILAMADSMWTVGVGGEEWSVNVTGAEIEGTPALGLKVKIEGVVGEGNIILASQVEVVQVEGEVGEDEAGEDQVE